MQTLNALVALTGDRNNMFLKVGLTPAEVLLLQQLHGADAIVQIEPTGDVKREPMEEIERLREQYPNHRDKVQNIWRDFPASAFPTRIDMLGLNPVFLKPVEAARPITVSAKSA